MYVETYNPSAVGQAMVKRAVINKKLLIAKTRENIKALGMNRDIELEMMVDANIRIRHMDSREVWDELQKFNKH